MRLKKEIIKTLIISIILIVVLIAGTVITIFVINNSKQEEPPQEEIVIEYEPYTDYDWSNLNREGYYSYEDDKYTSLFGIDVAAHQGTINWEKVKNAGVSFAYIRIGYRGAVEGILHEDLEFENNYEGATSNNINTGIYWYSQPINEEEAIEEARFVLDILDDRDLDLPIVYDLEETFFYDGSQSRMRGLKPSEYTKMAVAFCNEILKNHHEVMIYTNLDWALNHYIWSELEDIPIWFAQYDSIPRLNKPFVIWQYSETGIVDGIDTNVDLDIIFIRKNDQN